MDLVVRPSGPLKGRVELAGDKSLAHRVLAFGALARAEVTVRNWPDVGVTRALLEGLRALGLPAEVDAEAGVLRLRPSGPGGLNVPSEPIECGRSGATMRFLAGLLAGLRGEGELTGHPSLLRRPMRRLVAPLTALGAQVGTAPGGGGPLTIRGGALRGTDVVLEVASAQVETACALAAVQAEGTTRIRLPGAARDHTALLLASLGLPVEHSERELLIAGAPLAIPGFERTLPGDPSSAAFLMAAAAGLDGSDLVLPGVLANPMRSGMLRALLQMGAPIMKMRPRPVGKEWVADFWIPGPATRGALVQDLGTAAAIDEIPALVAAAALVGQGLEVRDASELRHKESDRIGDLAACFAELGVTVETLEDGLRVAPGGRPRGGTADARGDHRLAMALAVCGLGCRDGARIVGAEILQQSYPRFVEDLRGLGADLAWEDGIELG